MDADQLDLKITGHVVTPGRVLEDGWIGVRGEIVDADLVVLDPAGKTRLHPRGDAVERDPVAVPRHGLSREEPVPADPAVGSVLAEAADRTGRPCLRLPSHAGHDANQMAKIAPISMLFAPSRDGRSHCPEEWAEPDDIAVCLTAAVIRLNEELAP